MKRYLILPVCTCSLIISLLARGQDLTPANAFAGLTYNLTISPTEAWVDTHIDLHPGDALQIDAVTGTGGCSPNGAKTSQHDTLPLNTALPGALIGKLSEGVTLFFVGSRKELKVVQLEHLYLGLNASGPLSCTGNILVKLQLISAPTQATATAESKLAAAAQTWLSGQFGTGPAEPASTPQGASAASDAPPGSASESAAAAAIRSIPTLKGANVPLDTELCKIVDGLPRRVNDEFHNLGDMVNFVIVGSEQQVQNAFEAAGWRRHPRYRVREGPAQRGGDPQDRSCCRRRARLHLRNSRKDGEDQKHELSPATESPLRSEKCHWRPISLRWSPTCDFPSIDVWSSKRCQYAFRTSIPPQPEMEKIFLRHDSRERTDDKTTQAVHRRRASRHPETPLFGEGSGFGSL